MVLSRSLCSSVCVLLQVRVYVNGQLAGFTPIYYTMYTVRLGAYMHKAGVPAVRACATPDGVSGHSRKSTMWPVRRPAYPPTQNVVAGQF